MRIERDRVRALEAGVACAMSGQRGADRAVRAVHVEPQALGGTEIGDLTERVDRARADGSRARRDAERVHARGAVGGDGGTQ